MDGSIGSALVVSVMAAEVMPETAEAALAIGVTDALVTCPRASSATWSVEFEAP